MGAGAFASAPIALFRDTLSDKQDMWADTLMALERMHLERMLVWGLMSFGSGSAILALVVLRHMPAALLKNFALQMAVWGAIIALFAMRGINQLHLRDFAGAQAVVSLLWLNVGLAVGFVATGLVLMIASWRWQQGSSVIGAGLAIVLHGLVILALDGHFLGAMGPVA